MKIRCEEFKHWYPAYKNGKLSNINKQLVAEHLGSCEGCQLAAQAIEAVLETTIQPESDPFFYTRLSARLEKEKAPRVVRVLKPAFILSLALSLSILIGIRMGTILYEKFSASDTSSLIEQDYALSTSVSQLDQMFYDVNAENQ
ncbi:MAG: zf-HC2 domain-containing protein [Bacteroidales bacterium]